MTRRPMFANMAHTMKVRKKAVKMEKKDSEPVLDFHVRLRGEVAEYLLQEAAAREHSWSKTVALLLKQHMQERNDG